MTSSSTSPWLTSTSPSATACSAPTANRPTSRSSTVSPDASRTNALSRLGQQRLARAVQVVDQAVRDGELGGQTSQVVLGVLQRAVEAADLEEVAPLRDRQQEAAGEERPEEGRVGKGCVGTGSSRWGPNN